MAAMGVPMGGWKQSGIGYRHGEYGIKKYCRAESIVVTRFARQARTDLVPVHEVPPRPGRRLAQAFNARDLKRRLGKRG